MMIQIPSKKTGAAPFFLSFVVLLICAFLMQSCNSATNGAISTSSTDSYKLIQEGEDSLEIRHHVWQKADDFCRKKNQYFMPIAKNYNQTFYEMEFRCLNAGDPELLEGETPFQEKRYKKKLGGYGKVQY